MSGKKHYLGKLCSGNILYREKMFEKGNDTRKENMLAGKILWWNTRKGVGVRQLWRKNK